MEELNELALFAGAGGGILAGKLLGWRTVCAVEYGSYPIAVLTQRQNDGILAPFPIWDDIRTFDGKPWRRVVDVVSGGFPCQKFSTATHGRSVADDLWPDMLRVVKEVEPRLVFAENVAEKAIKKAAQDLEDYGYKTETIMLSAQNMGADHVRERHWLLAYSDMHGQLRGQVNAKMAGLPTLYSRVWQADPGESRMANGVAYRMDRLKATGNGQVPLVAAKAFSILMNRFKN